MSLEADLIEDRNNNKLEKNVKNNKIQKCNRCKILIEMDGIFCRNCGYQLKKNIIKPVKISEVKRVLRIPPLDTYSNISTTQSQTTTKKRKKQQIIKTSSSMTLPIDERIEQYKRSFHPVPKDKLRSLTYKTLCLEQMNAAGFNTLEQSTILLSRSSRSEPSRKSANNPLIQRLPSIDRLYKNLHNHEVVYYSYTDKERFLHFPVKIIKQEDPIEDNRINEQSQSSSFDSSTVTETKAWLWRDSVASLIDTVNDDDESISNNNTNSDLDYATNSIDTFSSVNTDPNDDRIPSIERTKLGSQLEEHTVSEVDGDENSYLEEENDHPTIQRGDSDVASVQTDDSSVDMSELSFDQNEIDKYRAFYLLPNSAISSSAVSECSESTSGSLAGSTKNFVEQDQIHSNDLTDQLLKFIRKKELTSQQRLKKFFDMENEEHMPHPDLNTIDSNDNNSYILPSAAEIRPNELVEHNNDHASVDDSFIGARSIGSFGMIVHEKDEGIARDQALLYHLRDQIHNLEEKQLEKELSRAALVKKEDDLMLFSPFSLLPSIEEMNNGIRKEDITEPKPVAMPISAQEEYQHINHLHKHNEDINLIDKITSSFDQIVVNKDERAKSRHKQLHRNIAASAGDDYNSEDDYDNDDWVIALMEKDERFLKNNPNKTMKLDEQWRAIKIGKGNVNNRTGSRNSSRGSSRGNSRDNSRSKLDNHSIDNILEHEQHLLSTNNSNIDNISDILEGNGHRLLTAASKYHRTITRNGHEGPLDFDMDTSMLSADRTAFASHIITSHIFITSQQSMKKVLAILDTVDLRISIDRLNGQRIEQLTQAVEKGYYLIKESEDIDHLVKVTVQNFYEKAREQRAEIAHKISFQLQKSIKIEEFFKAQIQALQHEEAVLKAERMKKGNYNHLARHQNEDSEELQELKKQAELAYKKAGEEVDILQQEENQIIARLRLVNFIVYDDHMHLIITIKTD
jgi:hypothetical protein